jgi:ribosomal protein S18 acetylase RimI-like enzyme
VIAEIDQAAFTATADDLVAVYAGAMNAPAEQLSGRRVIMAGHAAYPGFRALTARVTEELAGFCYGFHGQNGQWWHDRVAESVASSDAATWLADCLEVAELHVLPRFQGQGLGRDLLYTLAEARPERTAVLSTRDWDSPARQLYRSAGFTDLLTGFVFDGSGPSYAIMGAELPLRARPSRW